MATAQVENPQVSDQGPSAEERLGVPRRTIVLEAWTTRALPTLLFLYEPESKIAYWVEVTRSAAKVTDNAFTILVPRDNELCRGERVSAR